ncbi:hypothetical protein ACP8Y2_06790 [Herpetosiphon llansteffanensis]
MKRVHYRQLRSQITSLKERHRRTEQTIMRVQRTAAGNSLFEHTSREELLASMYSSQRRDQEHILILEAEIESLDSLIVREAG